MKENKYDNDVFFKKYSQMGRSKDGLIAAGEWETLKRLLPSFEGKKVLDVGCGYGWHCIYAAENNASSVIGVDISSKMLEVAREKTSFPQVEYICAAMEDMNFSKDSFDVILSSLAFHYVKDFNMVLNNICSYLKSGGHFVFSVEHPVFTSYGTQDWIYEDGNPMHFPVDNYFYEGKRVTTFLGEDVIKYHRTLTTYLNSLLKCGFIIEEIVEPQPSQHLIDTVPGMDNEMRRPMMLIISAYKK